MKLKTFDLKLQTKMHDIKQQLNKLKLEETPDEAWVVSTRERLLAQIDVPQVSVWDRFVNRFKIMTDSLVYAPARIAVIALVVLVGFSTSFMVQASPGSALYPGRIMIEKVELILASSAAEEAAVHNKHAQKRLADVRKIQQSVSTQDDSQLGGTVKRLEKDLSSAAASLEIARAENGNNQELDRVALDINHSASSTADVLSQTKESTIASHTLTVLEEALHTSSLVKDETLGVLVNMYAQEQITAEETAVKVSAILENQLTTVSQQVQLIEQRVNQAQDVDEDDYDWQEMYTHIRQASAILGRAKADVQAGKYSTGFDKLSQVKQLISNVEAELPDLSEVE